MMKRLLPIIAAMLVVGIAAGMMMFQSSRTTASHHKMPKPPTYPFAEARKIAEANLPSYMGAIGPYYENSGFKNEEETKRASLGTPYISYGFDLRNMALPDYRKGDFREQLDVGVNIEFPVLVDGEPRSNISVTYRDQVWQDGPWGGYWPGLIVKLQDRLASQGITDRVDLVVFGMAWSTFGLIDYKGQTLLIPLDDTGKYFPSLDFSGERMYTLDEVLPLVHEQSVKIVEELDRQDQEFRLRYPTSDPNRPEPVFPTEPPTPKPGPFSTVTPEGMASPDPNQLGPANPESSEVLPTLTPEGAP